MVLHFARNIQNLAIFCRKTDNKLTTRIGGEGVAELSPLDPIIDSCPDKNFHNWDFGGKFEKTQELDDALRRCLGGLDETYTIYFRCSFFRLRDDAIGFRKEQKARHEA